MILTAGRATRLGALSEEAPKALLPLCNRPLVRWALALLRHHGIVRVTVNLHHLGQQIRDALGNGQADGVELLYSQETELLGTGGGIKAMAALRPASTTVIINGKVITDLDLRAVLEVHRRRNSLATLVLFEQPHACAWGALQLDQRQRVVRLLDVRSPTPQGPLSAPLMFTGIHVVQPELFDLIAEGPGCVIRGAYSDLVAQGAPIDGYVHQGYFYEHSTPGRYLQGNLNLLDGQVTPAASFGPLRGVDSRARVAPGARLVEPLLVGPEAVVQQGAMVGPGVVLGRASRVAAGVRLCDSVVWPGAQVAQSGRRAIITPHQWLDVAQQDDPMQVPR